MPIDRSNRLYRVEDVRVFEGGIDMNDALLGDLWHHKRFWMRANAHAYRFGRLLAIEGFALPGFHSVYLYPTMKRLRLQRSEISAFDWWHREIAVPLDVEAWGRAKCDQSGVTVDIETINWIEHGLLFVAKRFKRSPDPVKRVAQRLRERGDDALVLLTEKKNRFGTASALLRVSPRWPGSELVIRVVLNREPEVVREARLKLLIPDHAYSLCHAVKFNETTIEISRKQSLRIKAMNESYPKKLIYKLNKMTMKVASK